MSLLVRQTFKQIIAICLLIMSGQSFAAPTEQQVKAAYLYQLSKLTTWPENKVAQEIHICVIDKTDFADVLKTIHNRKSHGRSIQVHFIDKTQATDHCHILYIGHINPNTIRPFSQNLATQHVLLIGDQTDFARLGGMVGFTVKAGKVRLNINLQSIFTAGLKLHPSLHNIAQNVIKRK